MSGVAATPKLLFVCHANLCRSPMAERLARVLGAGRVEVTSAGTHARPGLPMHEFAESTLYELGADPTGFTSRPVDPAMVAEADLVLTADRRQRSICADLVPAAVRRTFTIRQFGRLAAAVLDAGLAAGPETLLRAVAAVRADLPPVPGEEDDLADPVLGTREDFLACARQITRALEPTLALIARP
jgi:protein-tyrosine phosphatase